MHKRRRGAGQPAAVGRRLLAELTNQNLWAGCPEDSSVKSYFSTAHHAARARPAPEGMDPVKTGALPVPAERVGPRTIPVNLGAATAYPAVGLGSFVRVSSHDQRSDLERRVAR
jgi:hypothetical protein